MRILNVHNYYLQPGGEDTVLHATTNLLRSHGHEVREYLQFNKEIASLNRISVALRTIWSSESFHKLKVVLQDWKPDIVHFHNTFPLVSPSAYYACNEEGIPTVQTIHNQRLICPAASFYREGKLCLDCLGKTPAWPGIIHGCYHGSRSHTAVVASMAALHRWMGTWETKIDTYICSTKFYRDIFIKAGFPAEKIVVVPHFIPDGLHISSSKAPGHYALYIGRLSPEKGIKNLLEAWKYLEFPLIIRGSGELEIQAREFAHKNQLDQIQFLDRMEQEDLSNLISNARFLIMPSEGYYETFGMVIIEAFARKVPVLASNIGVVPELITDQETGLLFEAGNPIDLAQKAKWLWDHPGQARSMAERSYIEYKQKYTADRGYQMLHDVYVQTITRKKG